MSEIIPRPREIRPIDTVEQLITIREIDGFLPLSTDELDEAFALMSDPMRTPQRVSDVMSHQRQFFVRQQSSGKQRSRNLTVVASDAARAVTREYIGYVRGSAAGIEMLQGLGSELAEPISPNVQARTITNRKNALLALIQFADIEAFSRGDETVGQPLERKYTGQGVDDYLTTRLDDIRVRDARRLLPAVLQNKERRYKFWRDRVHSLMIHEVARPVVEQAIRLKPL